MSAFILSDEGLNLIKHFEGCKLDAYLDSVGVATIGYGHTRGVHLGDSCTQEQADKWLKEDAGWSAASVNQMVTAEIEQCMFDALVSFTFNLGSTALRNSTLLKKLNAGEPAAAEFLRWDHAGNKVLPGLTRRREAEKKLFDEAEDD